MKGFGTIGIIIAGLIAAIAIFAAYKGINNYAMKSQPYPSPSYTSLSEDPKYKEVKEKYNLSEEQLQILSTVDPNDND